ncbi:hypothetical protein FXO38_32512 [Capsicum annuum]|nr:hypothetical protein FXO38_32512 [Capsicum annuum]
MELFVATTIRRKISLEGGLVTIDDSSGSGAVVRDNDASLTVFETKSHYDYDYTDCTDFSSYFATSSECSVCKCQDCKVKHDGVINSINALTASVKEMTSKRGVIPSKRISYLYTPLEIKEAKRRRKDTSKALSSIEKSKFPDVTSLIPASPNASSGLSFGRQRAKDPGMVFVSGATGQAGIRIARILLREGYSVKGGVSDLGAAQELAHLAISYKIEHNWDGITLKDFILKRSVPLSVYSWIKGTMKARAYHLSCTKGARCAGRSHLKRKLDLEFQPEEE